MPGKKHRSKNARSANNQAAPAAPVPDLQSGLSNGTQQPAPTPVPPPAGSTQPPSSVTQFTTNTIVPPSTPNPQKPSILSHQHGIVSKAHALLNIWRQDLHAEITGPDGWKLATKLLAAAGASVTLILTAVSLLFTAQQVTVQVNSHRIETSEKAYSQFVADLSSQDEALRIGALTRIPEMLSRKTPESVKAWADPNSPPYRADDIKRLLQFYLRRRAMAPNTVAYVDTRAPLTSEETATLLEVLKHLSPSCWYGNSPSPQRTLARDSLEWVWREPPQDYEGPRPSDLFDRVSLTRPKLAGQALNKARFIGCSMCDANFEGADLMGAFISFCALTNCDLTGAKAGCTFENSSLSGGRFSHVLLVFSRFISCTLTTASFDNADIGGAVFDGSDLSSAKFIAAHGLSLTFAQGDVPNAATLIKQWATSTNELPCYIRARFASIKQQINSALIQDASQAESLVCEVLNSLLDDKELSAKISSSDISNHSRQLLAQSPRGRTLRLLNRLLLQDAYPSFLQLKPPPNAPASFYNCLLDSTEFTGVILPEATFKEAKLTKATFENCRIMGSSFLNAKFDRTSFRGTDIAGCDFTGATFTNSCDLELIMSARNAWFGDSQGLSDTEKMILTQKGAVFTHRPPTSP